MGGNSTNGCICIFTASPPLKSELNLCWIDDCVLLYSGEDEGVHQQQPHFPASSSSCMHYEESAFNYLSVGHRQYKGTGEALCLSIYLASQPASSWVSYLLVILLLSNNKMN